MIINPLIEELKECIEDGSTSTVDSDLLRKVVEVMEVADECINDFDAFFKSIEK